MSFLNYIPRTKELETIFMDAQDTPKIIIESSESGYTAKFLEGKKMWISAPGRTPMEALISLEIVAKNFLDDV